MNVDSSFISYFLNAGLVVKSVLLLLVLASLLSWTYILQKRAYLKKVERTSQAFEENFWSGGDLNKLYADSQRRQGTLMGTEALFFAGFKEFLRVSKVFGNHSTGMLDNARRAMHVAEMQELERLEAQLPTLATVGSTSPYVGLFGTVWGIMLSFKALATVQQATIAMVAPGLAEALIATAMGLFTAIPAVMAYNRYANQVNRLANRFVSFQESLSNILYRQHQHQTNTVAVPQEA